MIEDRMKQLRDMINSDFNNMVDFGNKVAVKVLNIPLGHEAEIVDLSLGWISSTPETNRATSDGRNSHDGRWFVHRLSLQASTRT